MGTEGQERATRVRFGVLAFMCGLTFILYLDRICISQAQVPMQDELGISDTQMAFIHGAFLVAYGLFELPMGRWGDRHGSRGVLLRIVVWWSAFTALTGAATGLGMLLAIRFLFGAGEAGALPNVARVLKTWFPATSRGRAQGLLTTSTLLGGVAAPVLAQFLINRVGWRWTFVVFGAVGVVWAVTFYLWFRDLPAQHPAVNEAERDLIADGVQPSSTAHAHPPIPWRLVFTSHNVWLLSLAILCSTFNAYLNYSWYPSYLQKARAVSPELASKLTSMVLAGGAVGCLTGGFLGDYLLRRTGNRRWVRRATGGGGLAVAAVGMLVSIHLDNPAAAAVCNTLAFFAANIHLTTWWATAAEISGRHLGAIFGLMNSIGAIGGVSSNLFIGSLADFLKRQGYSGRDQWDPAFYGYAAVLLVGATGWLFIDASRPVEAEEHA